jgi:hypothetical protein
MGRRLIFGLLCGAVISGCSSFAPDEQRDIAFQKYSLDCVARGIPEDTPEHTRCVLDKYEANKTEQVRGMEELEKLYGEKPDETSEQASSEDF